MPKISKDAVLQTAGVALMLAVMALLAWRFDFIHFLIRTEARIGQMDRKTGANELGLTGLERQRCIDTGTQVQPGGAGRCVLWQRKLGSQACVKDPDLKRPAGAGIHALGCPAALADRKFAGGTFPGAVAFALGELPQILLDDQSGQRPRQLALARDRQLDPATAP